MAGQSLVMWEKFFRLRSGLEELKRTPRRLVFAFHRVSGNRPTADDPFSRLAALSPRGFRILIAILGRIGRFSDLESVLSTPPDGNPRPFIHLTFDDVSRSVLDNVLPVIERHRIPVTVFPSAVNAERGYSWRDMIYFILSDRALVEELTDRVRQRFPVGKEFTPGRAYTWSKSALLDSNVMEKEILEEVLEKRSEEFRSLVDRHRPYLDWKDLRALSGHPLITIGSHGFAHANYGSLTEEQVEADIASGHRRFQERLGFSPLHFAVPFGGLDQKTYLAVDRALSGLGYRTAAWGRRAGNPRLIGHGPRHYVRIDAGTGLAVNTVKTAKAVARTQLFPLQGLPFSSSGGESDAEFSFEVSDRDYTTFFRRLQPQKAHHQSPAYIHHLYNDNPFREGRSSHLSIKAGGEVMAIASLFYVPFRVGRRELAGAYFCGWYRFPQLPGSGARARIIFDRAREMVPVLGAYDPSPNSLHFYKDWDRVRVQRLAGRPAGGHGGRSGPADLVESPAWDPRLQPVIDKAQAGLRLTVRRGSDLYRWRVEKYPLCRYSYLFPDQTRPSWFIVLCRHRESIHVSDFCLDDPGNKELAGEILDAVIGWARDKEVREIFIETSNRPVLDAARKRGFRLKRSFINVYRYPGSEGRELDWRSVHETQICGDLLPRFPDVPDASAS